MQTLNNNSEYLNTILQNLKIPIVAQIEALKIFLSDYTNHLTQDEKDTIKLVLNSCNYTYNILDEINILKKTLNEKIHPNYSRFNIANVIQEILEDLNITLKYHNLNIIQNFPKELILNADKTKIKKVINNLLSNIIKYANQNSNITIYAKEIRNEFKFEIQYKSHNFSIEEIEKLFKEFDFNETSFELFILNLDFYLSNEIIKTHFGKINITNKVDKECILGFTLPI